MSKLILRLPVLLSREGKLLILRTCAEAGLTFHYGMPKSAPAESFTMCAVRVIKRIPRGKVATYGQVAAMAGSPQGARQVVRILNTRSRIDKLPWHRIINRLGYVALPPGGGFELQRELLRKEGVFSDGAGKIDLAKYLWKPKVR